MRTEEVRFPSAGLELAGLLRLPDAPPSSVLPVVVQGPGFLGLAGAAHYVRYHEALTAAGFAVLVFDYRGYGASEGEPGWILPERQVDDIRSALGFVETRPGLDRERIGLLGLGATGAGNAILVAARDERVRAVAVIHAVADGADWLRRMRDGAEWEAFRARVAAGDALVDPRTEIMIPRPERRALKRAVDAALPARFHLASATALLAYRPVDEAHRVRALLLVSVVGDDATPEDHARALFDRARPPKKLLRVRGTTHYKVHEEAFGVVAPEIVRHFERHLRGRSAADVEVAEVAAAVPA